MGSFGYIVNQIFGREIEAAIFVLVAMASTAAIIAVVLIW